jgi:hypothetical protein
VTPNRAFIVTHRDTLFHAAYHMAQSAIGELDGGVASLYDDSRFGYHDTFANEGGAGPINAILEYVGGLDLVHRLQAAEVPHVDQFDGVSGEAILEIAQQVTTQWIAFLLQQFPEVPGDQIRNTANDAESAFAHYLRFEQAYTDAYGTPHQRGPEALSGPTA